MKKIKVAFCNFWSTFNKKDNFLLDALKVNCIPEVVEIDESPDILFFSQTGKPQHLKVRDCVKIYFTGENEAPNFIVCDYAISHHDIKFGNRHFRLPVYCYHNDSFNRLRCGERHRHTNPFHREFGSAVISNNFCAAPVRSDFIAALEKLRPIASGGRVNNNVGGPVDDKIDFIGHYKFNIAMENSMVDDYTTEKLVDALYAGTVPIYWGNRKVGKQFNPEAFIDISDFDSFDSAIEYILRVDADEDLYNKYLEAVPVLENESIDWETRLAEFLLPAVNGQRHLPQFGIQVSEYGKLKTAYNLSSYDFLVRNLPKLNKIYEKIRGVER